MESDRYRTLLYLLRLAIVQAVNDKYTLVQYAHTIEGLRVSAELAEQKSPFQGEIFAAPKN